MKKRFVFFLMVSGGLFLFNLLLPVSTSAKDSDFYAGMIVMWGCYTIADLRGYFDE